MATPIYASVVMSSGRAASIYVARLGKRLSLPLHLSEGLANGRNGTFRRVVGRTEAAESAFRKMAQ